MISLRKVDAGAACARSVFGHYLIFFSVCDATVIVWRILHDARDCATLLETPVTVMS